MKLTIRVAPAATADTDGQASYLARRAGPEIAIRFNAAAIDTFEAIARNPGLGERRAGPPHLGDMRVRRVEGFENYIVFYRSDEQQIEIVRVLHASRNLDRIIEADPGRR